jgi:hypothetical protein
MVKSMDEMIDEIFKSFGKKLVGTLPLKMHVCEVVALLPKERRDYITANCWFVGSFDDAWAFTFTGNDLKNQHLIFLSDELLLQDTHQIHYTIAHEIGHVILNHRNSVLSKQTKQEIDIQEKEADDFAVKYLKD